MINCLEWVTDNITSFFCVYSASQWVVSILAFMTRSEVSLHIVPLRRRHNRPANKTHAASFDSSKKELFFPFTLKMISFLSFFSTMFWR